MEFESGQIDVAPSLSGIRSPGVLLPWFNLVQPGSAKKGGKLMGGLECLSRLVANSVAMVKIKIKEKNNP